MKRTRSPSTDLVAAFRALPAELPLVSLLSGVGEEGFTPTLTWAPAATFSGTLKTPAGFGEAFRAFVDEQVALGRLLIGFFSYELGHLLHGLPDPEKPGPRTPDYHFLAYENWLELREGQLVLHGSSPDFAAQWQAAAAGAPLPSRSPSRIDLRLTTTERAYSERYRRIQDYIRSGDVYQINLTHRLEGRTSLGDRELFAFVAEDNPVEHLAYLEAPPFSILSASPERFVRIARRSIETLPIKGTRPRSLDPEQDQRFRQELLASGKEAAELAMITDLLRNDVGRVSRPGSVEVVEYRALRAGPAVWHTLSRVRGSLREQVHPIEALLSMLPGGSISGCPKRRALEVIAELESSRRGVYTGVIVRVDPDCGIDSSVAIRTLVKQGEQVCLSVGGGIVYDSVERDEFEETLSKATSFAKLPSEPAQK